MKRKYFKKGIASLGLGGFLIVLSIYSSNFLIKADATTLLINQGLGTARIVFIVGAVMIGLAIGFFVMAAVNSEK